MTHEQPTTQPSARHQAENDPAELKNDDLDSVAGGTIGPVYDVYKILSESWSDIKQGFTDAMND